MHPYEPPEYLYDLLSPMSLMTFPQCFLACHKRCLETLLIHCGHKRLPARTPLFGVSFLQLPRDFPVSLFIVSNKRKPDTHPLWKCILLEGVRGVLSLSVMADSL